MLETDCRERTDATAEKAARASLFSAVTRQLSPDRIVIFDGMNYIKGFRYQLYCAAREYKCRTCTVSPSNYLTKVNFRLDIYRFDIAIT